MQQAACAPLLDSEFGEVLRRPRQHGFTAPRDDRSLDKLRMFCHDAEQFMIAEIPIGNVLRIRGFVLPERVLRLQPGTAE